MGRSQLLCGSAGISSRGFTLIELMVVVVIVAVVAGAVMISFGGADRRQLLIGEAERLAALVRLARDEALLEAVELGLRTERDQYSFLIWNPASGLWQELDAPRNPLRPRQLPDGVELRLTSETLPKLAAAERSDNNSGGGDTPDVLILSSGEITPFEAEFATSAGQDGPRWLVLADGVQDPVAMSPDAADEATRGRSGRAMVPGAGR